jgi:hypothetical protein
MIETKGEQVICTTCGKPKKPIGRDAPIRMAGSLCDYDCPGYNQVPYPGQLWPGETLEDLTGGK